MIPVATFFARKPGDAETYCDDVFELLESVTQCRTERMDLLYDLFDFVYRFFSNQKRDIVKVNLRKLSKKQKKL